MGRLRAMGTALATTVAVVAGAACVPPGTPPPSFALSVEVSELSRPWDLAFTPDGTLLYTERVGRIGAFVGGVKRTIAAPPDAVSLSEGGMMGLAVDPAFAANRRIYACFLSNAVAGLDVRIVRFEVSADLSSVSERADIVTGIPVNQAGQAGRHSGCRLRFGPDGYLWATAGDAVTASVPQDPKSLGGKVLRVTTDGAGAPGNPGGVLRPEIYSLGHRNPQGVTFRPSDGKPYSVEHGTGCDDEVNLLVPGGNYGWDPSRPDGSYWEDAPMTSTSIAGAISAVWSSGCPTIAPSGGAFISGSEWGAWNGSLVMAVLKGSQLRVLALDGGGSAVVEQWISLTDYGRLRVAVQAPDGDMLVATDADPGFVLRLSPP